MSAGILVLLLLAVGGCGSNPKPSSENVDGDANGAVLEDLDATQSAEEQDALDGAEEQEALDAAEEEQAAADEEQAIEDEEQAIEDEEQAAFDAAEQEDAALQDDFDEHLALDPTPEKLDGTSSYEFEPEDLEAAGGASGAVKRYCAGAVSEAQRLGCESHVTSVP